MDAYVGSSIALVTLLFLMGKTEATQAPAFVPEQQERCRGEEDAVGKIGREVSVAMHLRDGQEFSVPLAALITHGQLIFNANWTDQEGGGRPLTKGTGRPLSDPSQPLTGRQAFNRISGPDANSCAGCHNMPYGIAGGSGDFVTNVFVLAQRFDFADFNRKDALATKGSAAEDLRPVTPDDVGNLRRTTGMFGAGYLEMLARQITAELQQIRGTIKRGDTKELVAKGVRFGQLTLTREGLWDTSRVEGLPRLSLLSTGSNNPPTLVIRPWHQAANVVSIREFTNNAFNQHHGIQSTERFGIDTDPDGDGFTNELTRADVAALLPVGSRISAAAESFRARQWPPGRQG